MPFITLGTTSQLQIKVPTKGTTNWDETMRTDTFLKIAEHDHSGTSGNGTQLSTAAFAANSVTGAKIRLDNDEYLRARNAANSADLELLKANSSDEIVFNTTVGTIELQDDGLTIVDNGDNAKKLAFDASGITTSNTRTLTAPDYDGTIATLAGTETLTNKTLTLPVISSISNSGTLTLPTGAETLVARATTDTLTNKTIDADNNTISNLAHGAEVDQPSSGVHGVTGTIVGTSDTQTLTNKTIDGDNNTISNLAHGAEVDNPSSGVHGVTGSVVGTSDTQTLTNKTIDAGTIDTYVDLTHETTPSNPSAGNLRFYAKSNNTLYVLDSSGTETAIATGGGSDNVAYIYDKRSSGTSGGSSVTTSFGNTRVLNVLQGDTSFISLGGGTTGVNGTADNFTLDAGDYDISWSTVARSSGGSDHSSRLYNTSDCSTELEGMSMGGSADDVQNLTGAGRISIASSKTFEIQVDVDAAVSGDGLGKAVNNGQDEVYTIVTIRERS